MVALPEHEENRRLVAEVLAGRRESYAELIHLYQGPVYNLALRMTGDSGDQAADLCQEIFTRAWLKLPRYDPARPFFTWLYTLALNVIRNHLARERGRGRSLTAAEGEIATAATSDPAAMAQARDRNTLLQASLAQLPLEQREALLLRYYQDVAYADLAVILGISESAAKMRVSRGLVALRRILAGQNNCELL